MPHADVSVILRLGEPMDCTWGKKFTALGFPTNDSFVHELGHAAFGLADEYNDTDFPYTKYFKPNPYPNIWKKEEDCRNYSIDYGWDPNDCYKFCDFFLACGSGWWRLDNINIMSDNPIYDIFGLGYGRAGIKRIQWVLDEIGLGAGFKYGVPTGLFDKAIIAEMNINNGTVTLLNSSIVYGVSINYLDEELQFNTTIYALNGSELGSFALRDPRIAIPDKGSNFSSWTDNINFTVVLPYIQDAKIINIKNESDKELIEINIIDDIYDLCLVSDDMCDSDCDEGIDPDCWKPLIITILSPVNNTVYNSTSVDLNWTVDKEVDWCGYSLDAQQNTTLEQEELLSTYDNMSIDNRNTKWYPVYSGKGFQIYNSTDYSYQSTYTSTNPPKIYTLVSNTSIGGKLGTNGLGFAGKWATAKIKGVGNAGGLGLGYNFTSAAWNYMCNDCYMVRYDADGIFRMFARVKGSSTEIGSSVTNLSSILTNFNFYKENGRVIFIYNRVTRINVSDTKINFTDGNAQFGAWGYEDGANTNWYRLANVSIMYKPVDDRLENLSEGFHNITIYCNDTSGNMGQSDYVYFTVKTCINNDGDGFNQSKEGCGISDCDDSNSSIYPGAVEICDNNVDDDCDNSVDGYDTDCGKCTVNSDCGIDGWVGSTSCSQDDVFQNWRTYTCNNPGTGESSCSYNDELQLKQDCGVDSYSGNYCFEDDVYRDFTDRGCSLGSCFNNTYEDEQKVAECGNAGCENGNCLSGVWLLNPENMDEFSRTITETFNWGASSEYTSFKIEVSQNSDFGIKRSLGKTIKINKNYKATETDWKNLRKLANIDSDGILYWRVYGQGTSKKYSNVYKFTLAPPTAPSLLTPDEGKILVAGDRFSWDYGSYTQAELKISTSTSFYTYLRLAKLKKSSGNSYYVDSSIYNKIKSFADKNGVTKLYWRVYVTDDEKLAGVSNIRSFNL